MKRLVVSLFALGLVASSAFAQSDSPPPAAGSSPPPAAGEPDGPGGPDAAGPQRGARGNNPNKEVIANCRSEAKSQGARGPALKEAIQACVEKANPNLAKRMKCQQDARAQGLKDTELRASVRSCLSRAG